MPTELADDATHEDIEAFVEQAVQDVEADRAGEQPEEKGDSQKIAEDHD